MFKVNQGKWTRYVGKASAVTLSKMSHMPEFGAFQESQRPLEEKRLQEISKYVDDHDHGGILSTSVVLGSTKRDMEVRPVSDEDDCQIYYVEFPETEKEFEKYKDAFDVIDGQHRLFSFRDKYVKIGNPEDFELSFELYVTPDRDQKRLIFKNTNEKQKAVDKNYLLFLKSELGLLTQTESKYYDVIKKLNDENSSPLHDILVVAGEKKKSYIKASEVMKIFTKTNINKTMSDIIGGDVDSTQIFNILKTYLTGWEKETGTTFSAMDSNFGPFYKISGLRYMLNLFKTIFNAASKQQSDFTVDFVKRQIKKMYGCDTLTTTANDFFRKDSSYNVNSRENLEAFRGESPTIELAIRHGKYLEEENDKPYNPVANS